MQITGDKKPHAHKTVQRKGNGQLSAYSHLTSLDLITIISTHLI